MWPGIVWFWSIHTASVNQEVTCLQKCFCPSFAPWWTQTFIFVNVQRERWSEFKTPGQIVAQYLRHCDDTYRINPGTCLCSQRRPSSKSYNVASYPERRCAFMCCVSRLCNIASTWCEVYKNKGCDSTVLSPLYNESSYTLYWHKVCIH